MILTDSEILQQINLGRIVISPFNRKCLGSNSYDVHLGQDLAIYNQEHLDAKKHNQVLRFKIPDQGFLMEPDELYLGVTQEYTETHHHVPFLEGKSSVGRLGIDIHATAGKGDVGFCNHWTLEISVKKPVIIYSGMPIGQLIYFEIKGSIEYSYLQKPNAKYRSLSKLPMESMMFKNFNHHKNIDKPSQRELIEKR